MTAQTYATIEGLLNTAINSWLPPVYGCTDSLAVNYNPLATVDNDSCDYTFYTIKTIGMSFSPDTIICDVGDTINFILGGYAFCFYEKFKEKKFLSQLKFVKGLEYFLEGHIQNQRQISGFIKLCKINEDKEGSLKQDFFSILQATKVKFLNGPFSNLIFDSCPSHKS